MTEENKANGTTPSEGEQVDLTKYVGKEDHEKALSAKDVEVTKLQAELDQAKMSLLDADYIEYLESKKSTPKEETADEIAAKEKGLPTKTEFDTLKKELGMTKAAVQDVLAALELKNTEERYPDFKDYKDQVKTILESSQAPLTFEQAYMIAKVSKPADGTAPAAPAKQTESEKPTGSVPGEGLEKKDFKDSNEAGNDAWDKTVGTDKDRL